MVDFGRFVVLKLLLVGVLLLLGFDDTSDDGADLLVVLLVLFDLVSEVSNLAEYDVIARLEQGLLLGTELLLKKLLLSFKHVVDL